MNRFVLKNTFIKVKIYHFLINIFIKIESKLGFGVTPSPIWNLAHGGPCAYYEIVVEDLVLPWLLRVGSTNI